ncbi:hypothetical protein BBW65_05240 [Helicobacter enhydrae]|uniref:Uncharacterized protein n=1 Tax=Helicobacter enhydrae TaxID=222136 RepID=A0A1B1U4S1_9HELI|nr:hypothetical protein BBW65_02525 [Helicobacter enhydrae]ANV98235.1 hypothetical protein BBW65_05240 [Helicobacter enhydrae]
MIFQTWFVLSFEVGLDKRVILCVSKISQFLFFGITLAKTTLLGFLCLTKTPKSVLHSNQDSTTKESPQEYRASQANFKRKPLEILESPKEYSLLPFNFSNHLEPKVFKPLSHNKTQK